MDTNQFWDYTVGLKLKCHNFGEVSNLLSGCGLDHNFFSIDLFNLPINPIHVWVFNPNMRTYNDIYWSPLQFTEVSS